MRSDSSSLTDQELAPAEALAPFLTAHELIPGGGELSITEIGDGHSNLTFVIRGGAVPLVLRRPPRPPYAESAHDVLREARLLSALHGHGVRLPEILATCEDVDLIGVPFVIMEFIAGVSISEELPAGVDEAGRNEIGDELIRALVALHAIDPRLAGLGDPERADSYLARQVHRFSSIWESQRTRQLIEMDQLATWLRANLPVTRRRAVVHGDFRLGNTLFSLDGTPRLTGLLDWELAALGDPLADLGYLLATWAEPGDEDNPMLRLSGATRNSGFATREELRLAYEWEAGISTDGITFYEVLGLWKSAIFLESSYRRFVEGRATDPYFGTLGEGIPTLARAALQRISEAT